MLLLLLPLILPAGCGRSFDGSVNGMVTLDGKPLATGTVTFHPVGSGPMAYGRIQADGRYSVVTASRQGLPPGEYVVTVVATAPPPNPKLEIPGELLTPVRYGRLDQSGLHFTVQRGQNTFDLPLVSK
jgi:hypothetical protein